MSRHAVYSLADNVLLVFKPEGHHEAEHAHSFQQHLRIVRGRLQVRLGAVVHELGPETGELVIARGAPHTTLALHDTWLLAQRR